MSSRPSPPPPPLSAPRRAPRRLWLALALLALLAGVLRATDLEAREMGHLEIFTPGIDLPESSLGPPPRTTLARTLTGTLWEPHPPGWYLFMLGWTRTFGQELATLRLPAVLAGALGVLLLGWLVRVESGWPSGLLAAALLALHGQHLFWSQASRPYVLVGTLAVGATLCLQLATRARRRRGAWLALYLALSALGMASLYYAWVVFAIQLAWVAWLEAAERRASSGLLRWQALLLVAASPLVTLAAFQSKGDALGGDPLGIGYRVLQMAFLFEVDVGDAALLAPWQAAALAALALLLVVAGLGPRAPREWPHPEDTFAGPRPLALGLVAALATAAILGGAELLADQRPARLHAMRWTALLPSALLIALWAYGRVAPRLWALLARLGSSRPPEATTLLGLAPWPALALISLRVPILAPHNFVVFVPFAMALLARGLVALANRPGAAPSPRRLVAFGAGLLIVFAASARAGLARPGPSVGFAHITEALRERLEPSDRIVVQAHFYSSALFYYLRDRFGQLVERDHARGLAATPDARVWVLRFEGHALGLGVVDALAPRTRAETLERGLLRLDLYLPATRLPR